MTEFFNFNSKIHQLFFAPLPNKINFATKIYRLSPLEKGGNEVSSGEFLVLFLTVKKEHYSLIMQSFF
jgi:hypothetical protein